MHRTQCIVKKSMNMVIIRGDIIFKKVKKSMNMVLIRGNNII